MCLNLQSTGWTGQTSLWSPTCNTNPRLKLLTWCYPRQDGQTSLQSINVQVTENENKNEKKWKNEKTQLHVQCIPLSRTMNPLTPFTSIPMRICLRFMGHCIPSSPIHSNKGTNHMTGDCFTAQQMTTGIAVVLAKFLANFFRKFYVLFGDRLRIISKWRLQGTLLRRQLVFLFELPGGRDINDDESSEANDGDAEVDHILSVTVTVIMLKWI